MSNLQLSNHNASAWFARKTNSNGFWMYFRASCKFHRSSLDWCCKHTLVQNQTCKPVGSTCNFNFQWKHRNRNEKLGWVLVAYLSWLEWLSLEQYHMKQRKSSITLILSKIRLLLVVAWTTVFLSCSVFKFKNVRVF